MNFTVGELLDMTPLERELHERVEELESEVEGLEDTLQVELADEQMSWLQDTVGHFAALAGDCRYMKVAQIRDRLEEILSENQADF